MQESGNSLQLEQKQNDVCKNILGRVLRKCYYARRLAKYFAIYSFFPKIRKPCEEDNIFGQNETKILIDFKSKFSLFCGKELFFVDDVRRTPVFNHKTSVMDVTCECTLKVWTGGSF